MTISEKMGKINIEYDLIEEAVNIRVALDGWKWKSIVVDIDNHIRSKIKYSNDDISDETLDTLIKIREEIKDLTESAGIVLDS